MTTEITAEQWWRMLLTGDGLQVPLRRMRHALGLVPAHVRCKFCNSPFDGVGAPAMRVVGRGPSRITSEFCQKCQVDSSRFIGGAEIELTLLFADVRGSTSLAEKMSTAEFSRLISRFFGVTSKVLLRSKAWVDRLVGDQVVGMYIPYYVGDDHQSVAIQGARDLLRMTGHSDPDGPWIPLGVGVHSGVAFVGAVGSEDSATDITALGDAPNVAARLSSAARAGEILMSEDTYSVAGLAPDLESRELELKGKSEPLTVRVLAGP
jgi:adenylate cyclase